MTFKFLQQFDFFTGVPDSQLKPLCDYLTQTYGTLSANHIIAANEGNAVALAAGYHLATGKVPVVYLQNSGVGNIINPVTSLLSPKVYGIPCLFIIGWRGQPGIHDEPQHLFMGEVTLTLLHDADIEPFVLTKETTLEQAKQQLVKWQQRFRAGRSAAFVVCKGVFEGAQEGTYSNPYQMRREDAIAHILPFIKDDIVVSTTGKASREIFELREKHGQVHNNDFLTVGSMGHASSIALGIALNCPQKRVWCLDGDGACLMHLGAMPVMGAVAPANIVHIVLNNHAHESVGGMPTPTGSMELAKVAQACGYKSYGCAQTSQELNARLEEICTRSMSGPIFLEVKTAIGSRADLGRPTIGPIENKNCLMQTLGSRPVQ